MVSSLSIETFIWRDPLISVDRVVAVAGFLSNFVVFGVSTIWGELLMQQRDDEKLIANLGVFSQAFATSILQGKASTLELMTVGSTANVCLNIFTPLSVLFVRYGTRFNYGLGSILMCAGIVLAGFSTEIWQLYLTFGILFGLGASFVYMVT